VAERGRLVRQKSPDEVSEHRMSISSSPASSGSPSVVPAGSDPVRENLSHRAYAQIRRNLTSSVLRPGHRLILRPLAAELGLSPTPVREALLRLVSEQALALDERGSAVVPVMNPADFRELSDLRGDLEARAAERAAEFAEAADVDELTPINEQCLAAFARSDLQEMLEHNATFHRAICRAGRSGLILRMLEGLWMRLGPVYALSLQDTLPPMAPGEHPHEKLIAALKARDPAAAREAALLDVQYSNRWLEPKLLEA